jgi:hypothetical protein
MKQFILFVFVSFNLFSQMEQSTNNLSISLNIDKMKSDSISYFSENILWIQSNTFYSLELLDNDVVRINDVVISENNVILEQNNPNPFSNETKINYYIPSDFKGQAELMLSDEKGSTIIQKLEACIGKPCSITISADGLNTGVYIYALLLDGKIIKSQKMMIIK